jgi:apolipoprotein N-acyltransferase
MLPPYESSFTIGRTRTLLPQPQSTWGVTICKDMDFTRLSREYGNDGAGLLLVPAWDFTADGWLHGRMAVMRGIDRAPKQGILTVTDDRGRVLAERDSSAQPFTTLIAEVPSRHQDTIYERLGDWFAWACVALLALIGIAEFRTGRINASRQANRTKMTALAP